MGVEELSIHTIPTQVVMCTFMLPLGTGIALSIRMGTTLQQSVSRTKELALGCWLISAVVFGGVAILCHTERHRIYRLFTLEAAIVQGADEIWWDVSIYLFHVCMFGINMGIITGLGMQWTLGFVTVVCLWVVGLPAAYYFAIIQGGGLVIAWKCIWPPYVAMNVILMAIFASKDWDEIAATIRLREGTGELAMETQPLRRKDDPEECATYGSTFNSSDYDRSKNI
jgi:MATE family multidrug resistance protein